VVTISRHQTSRDKTSLEAWNVLCVNCFPTSVTKIIYGIERSVIKNNRNGSFLGNTVIIRTVNLVDVRPILRSDDYDSRKWMAFLLGVHLIVPSPHYFPIYPYWALTWFAFDWIAGSGWVFFMPYMFVGFPAFVLIGLPTIIPVILTLILFGRKVHSTSHAFLCLALSFVLSAVYLYGWFDYTWPTPYQPVQTWSIALFTLLAYRYWSKKKQIKNPLKRTVGHKLEKCKNGFCCK